MFLPYYWLVNDCLVGSVLERKLESEWNRDFLRGVLEIQGHHEVYGNLYSNKLSRSCESRELSQTIG